MSIIKVCKCCLLISNNNMVSVNNGYDDLLESLLGSKLQEILSPGWLCYRCAHIIKKLSVFRDLCFKAASVLEEYYTKQINGTIIDSEFLIEEREKMISGGPSITNTQCIDMTSIDRKSNNKNMSVVSFFDSSLDKNSGNVFLSFNSCNQSDTEKEVVSKLRRGRRRVNTKKEIKDIKLTVDEHGSDSEEGFDITIIVKNGESDGNPTEILHEANLGEIKLCTVPLLEGNISDLELNLKDEQSCDNNDDDDHVQDTIVETEPETEKEVKQKKRKVGLNRHRRGRRQTDIHKGGKYKCGRCGLKFELAVHLEKHESVHTGQRNFVCDLCRRCFPLKSALQKHMQRHACERKRFACDECGKTFIFKKLLYKHRWTHSGESKPYNCCVCGRGFVFENELRAHSLLHTDARPFSCDKCGKAFTQRAFLKQHLLTHAEGQLYVCEECGRAFSQRAKLAYHRKTHMEVKPYACDICNRTFVRSGQLKTHMIYHTDDRPFVCETCGRAFRVKGALTAHRRVHSGERPYRCEVCGNSYTEAGYLKKHRRIHTGERPFSCDICERSFNETCTLARHKLTHSDERKHACTQCGSRFKYIGCLKKHAIRKHRHIPLLTQQIG